MPVETSDEDRRWEADKREFVADARDVAGARDAELDRWERELRLRAERLGWGAEASDEAKRIALPALVFAEIADQLYAADTYDEVLRRIAEAAVATVSGGDLASVTQRADGRYRTASSTSRRATAVDGEQFDAGEGPCLDALTKPLVEVPAFPDERWPVLGGRPRHHGVESSVSYRLGPTARDCDEAVLGSLNIYSGTPAGFDAAAIETGFVLAAHASVAARAVGERVSLEGLGHQLEEALRSRDVIGQAKGILMERLKTTPEEAFEILKRSSQRLNLKLREVAALVAETG